jgi:xylulokinase
MHAVIALDGAGEPLRFHPYPEKVDANFDALIDRFGVRELYALTGSRMDPTSVPPHIATWREIDPASFAQVKMILPVKDFLRYRLTGIFATDPIDAGGTMLFALHRKCWDPALLDWCGLDASHVPPVLSCTAVAGSLTAAAAEALQLTAGIPVSVGGGDDIEILGCGARGPNELCEHIGTTGSFLVPALALCEDLRMRLEQYPGINPGEWITGASCSNVARAFNWFLESSSYSCNGSIDWQRVQSDLSAGLQRLDASAPLFLPYLSGERAPLWQPKLCATWVGLRSSHGQPELLASAVEGICFSLRSLFDSFAPLGLQIETIFSSGGLNRLDTLELRASIYARPMRLVIDADPTSYAAAAVALASIGELADPWEASEWLQCSPAIEPNRQWQPLLEERYQRFVAQTESAKTREGPVSWVMDILYINSDRFTARHAEVPSANRCLILRILCGEYLPFAEI